MNKFHKKIMVIWAMFFVSYMILIIWIPRPTTYFFAGFWLGGLCLQLINFPYIDFLENAIDFYHKWNHKLFYSRIKLLEKLNKAVKKGEKKKK